MTSEDIVEMAKEAGFGNYAHEARGIFERFANLIATKIGDQQYSLGYLDGNAAGIREGVETEREACAKVCESLFDADDDSCNEAEQCAQAIRARSAA